MRLETSTSSASPELTLWTFRRLRPGLEVLLWDRRARIEVVWNLGPGSAQLIDAFADIALHPWAMLSIGQFKTPWTRYRLSSGGDQILVDWSRTTRLFGGERQRGVALGRAEVDAPGIYYKVGLFEGTNARTSHGVGLSNLYSRPLENRSDLFDTPPPSYVHPEIVGHLGWASTHMDATRLDDPGQAPLSVYVGMGIAHDLAPELMHDATTRTSGEVLLKWRGLSLYTGGYLLWHALTDGTSTLGLRGGLVELSWRMTRRASLGARYARIHTSMPLRQDAMKMRLTQGDDSEVARWMDEYGLGSKYDLYGEAVQLTTDLQLRRDAFAMATTWHDWVGRLQVQVSF